MKDGHLRPERLDHNRVEPGDAIGIGIRVPRDHLQVVADLLAPSVPSARIQGISGTVTIYPTVGRDRLNGRASSHRWVNVMTDPPAGVLPDGGLGGLACIGAPSNAINQMWWRHGLARVPGSVAMTLDRNRLLARIRIATAGGTLTASASFQPVGEPWVALPQHYYILNRDPPVLLTGDEWGTRHDGTGVVEFRTSRYEDVFEAYVGLDLDLGWDYVLGRT